jgi:GT2 family glycosyltransferase
LDCHPVIAAPRASVIVPTYNRRDSLARLIHSLEISMRSSAIAAEVLVVDNASTDDTSAWLLGKSREWPALCCFKEKRRGKNYALNQAIRHARGDILCFMDDDIVLARDWLAAAISAFERTGFDALQPRVLPGVDAESRPAEREILYQYNIPVVDFGDAERAIRGLTGVFMLIKRPVIEAVGGFDEALPASGYHGDTDLSQRIKGAGYSIGYTPRIVAFHELDPGRYGAGYARRSQYRKGLSKSLRGRDSIFARVMPNLTVNLMRYFWYRLTRRREKIYRTEKRIMKDWGYLNGRLQRQFGKDPWT